MMSTEDGYTTKRRYNHLFSRHHKSNRHKQQKKLSPKPPITLPVYYQTPNHFMSFIEPTTLITSYSSIKSSSHLNKKENDTKTNYIVQNNNDSTNLSKSSIHSMHSPSEISTKSSKSSHNNINTPSPKQSVYITQPKKKKITSTSNFYRHQIYDNNNNNSNDNNNYITNYNRLDDINFHSIYPSLTVTPNNSRKQHEPRKVKKKKRIRKKKDIEYNYNYNYNIISYKDDEIYIDITIDLETNMLEFNNYTISEIVQESEESELESDISEESYESVIEEEENKENLNIIKRQSQIIFDRIQSIEKHESILLEILKCRNRELVINAITYARCDVLCSFLPLIAFTLCQSDKLEWRVALLERLSERIVGQSDLKQAVKFLLESYNNITEVKAVFGPMIRKNNKHNNDIINFWTNIILNKYKNKKGNIEINDEIFIKCNLVIRDPINQLRAPINKVIIRKIINSANKPLLLDTYINNHLSSTFLLKHGDDLRKDKACMLVFKWINHLWRSKNITAHILTYKVIPMTTKLGCIEMVQDCVPLRDISNIKPILTLQPELINNLIISSAGSYIAAYLMGIRDRHFDNILIRKTSLELFHIDMNYILGDTLPFGIDTSQFGITSQLFDIFTEKYYKKFIDLSCKAFQLLRQYNEEFINFACLAFSYVCDYKTVRAHILKQLRMSESEYKAKNWLKNTLIKAPFDVQTQIKNKIHKFATR